MKKLLLALMAMFVVSTTALADATGLRIVMNEETEGVFEILFTASPVLSHNEDGTEISIAYQGAETPAVFKTANIAKMIFTEVEGTTALDQLYPAEKNAVKGIYSLDGKKISGMNDMQKGRVYIINGKKVLVK